MKTTRTIGGVVLLCALVISALAAPNASAMKTYTCAKTNPPTGGEWANAHCSGAPKSGQAYTHAVFNKNTNVTFTNAETKEAESAPAHFFVAKLHGVSEVEVNCTSVTGTGEAENVEESGVWHGRGTATMKFGGCTANHACTVTVAEAPLKDETVEGLASEGVGVKFSAKTGTTLTTFTFAGASCPLKAFGAIPVAGSAIATANGEAKGFGATWFFGLLDFLTVGGESAEFTSWWTPKGENGNALVWTR